MTATAPAAWTTTRVGVVDSITAAARLLTLLVASTAPAAPEKV